MLHARLASVPLSVALLAASSSIAAAPPGGGIDATLPGHVVHELNGRLEDDPDAFVASVTAPELELLRAAGGDEPARRERVRAALERIAARDDNAPAMTRILVAAYSDEREPAFGALVRSALDRLVAAGDAATAAADDDAALEAAASGALIAVLADGYHVYRDERYRHAAEERARLVRERFRYDRGRLAEVLTAGARQGQADGEQTARVLDGFLVLYRYTRDTDLLDAARGLADAARARLFDEQSGAWAREPGGPPDVETSLLMSRVMTMLFEATGQRGDLDAALRTLSYLSLMPGLTERQRAMHALVIHDMQRRHPAALRAGPTGPRPATKATDPDTAPRRVTVTAEPSTLRLAPGGAATVAVTMDLPRDQYVCAAEPGHADLAALAVRATSNAVAVELNVPDGSLRDFPARPAVRVLGGPLEFTVRVERTADLAKAARLVLTYQVITDDGIQRLSRRVLPVRLEPTAGE